MGPHQRHGDRGSTDADVAPLLPVYVRFADLVAANIVGSWTQLARLVRDEDFPEGILLSSNTRAWELTSIKEWLASRPAGRLPPEAQLRERDKRAAVEATS